MRTSDKFLYIFVGGILVIAAAALMLALNTPDPTYRDGAEPEDIAHNYLLALHLGDYERALGLLSPELSGRPQTPEELRGQIRASSWQFPAERDQDVAFTVLSAEMVGAAAFVDVRLTHFYGGGLFDSSRDTSTFQMELAQVGGVWKIVDAERSFLDCWTSTSPLAGCRR